MVAQYADACNVFSEPPVVRHLFDVLDAHWSSGGRWRTPRTKITARWAATAATAGRCAGPAAEPVHLGDAPAVQEQVQSMLDDGLDGIVFKSGQTPDTPGS